MYHIGITRTNNWQSWGLYAAALCLDYLDAVRPEGIFETEPDIPGTRLPIRNSEGFHDYIINEDFNNFEAYIPEANGNFTVGMVDEKRGIRWDFNGINNPVAENIETDNGRRKSLSVYGSNSVPFIGLRLLNHGVSYDHTEGAKKYICPEIWYEKR